MRRRNFEAEGQRLSPAADQIDDHQDAQRRDGSLKIARLCNDSDGQEDRVRRRLFPALKRLGLSASVPQPLINADCQPERQQRKRTHHQLGRAVPDIGRALADIDPLVVPRDIERSHQTQHKGGNGKDHRIHLPQRPAEQAAGNAVCQHDRARCDNAGGIDVLDLAKANEYFDAGMPAPLISGQKQKQRLSPAHPLCNAQVGVQIHVLQIMQQMIGDQKTHIEQHNAQQTAEHHAYPLLTLPVLQCVCLSCVHFRLHFPQALTYRFLPKNS